jgi:hypothetical protein
MCRCGADRNRLEDGGVTLEAVPQLHPSAPPSRHAFDSPLGRHLLGYRSDDEVERKVRMALKGAFAIGVLVVAAAMIAVTHQDPLPRRDNIQILSTLDEFTRDAEPTAPNTIPAFLEQPGSVGLLGPSARPDEPVKALDTADLREGFCSPSLARQIRHQYPGFYDAWPDETLEHLALEKYPEMRDQRCTLSYKVDASPVGIVKYQLKPRSLAESGSRWLLTIVATGLWAIGCANLYYRLLVERLAAA